MGGNDNVLNHHTRVTTKRKKSFAMYYNKKTYLFLDDPNLFNKIIVIFISSSL